MCVASPIVMGEWSMAVLLRQLFVKLLFYHMQADTLAVYVRSDIDACTCTCTCTGTFSIALSIGVCGFTHCCGCMVNGSIAKTAL